ncbi:MAG TPA: nitroreductase [Spongiibacteraceae bacterium]|nr:nitroreductase [Spongiibacteraceae bacterium]
MDNDSIVVDRAITSRRSIRRFLPTPVDTQTVRDILSVASRAPSGTNMQPWRVYVLGGARKNLLSNTIVAAHDAALVDKSLSYSAEYEYYPAQFPEPFLNRRRKVGWDLYGSLGIVKGDAERMHRQHARNYHFFDAPVGMLCTIERALEIGSWIDYGMFLQNICVAARARGLDTCPQAAFAKYHKIIRQQLAIGENEVVVCGMALGYADRDAPENCFSVERTPVDEFATFVDR